MSVKWLPAILLVFIFSGCASNNIVTMSNQVKTYGVSLEAKPNPAPGSIKVKSKPQGWQKNNKKDGYIGYDKGQSGFTAFSIKKEDLGDSCAESAEWVITKLELASAGDTSTEKGNNFGQPQPRWLKEAFPAVDLSNGELFGVADKADGRTFLLVHNANAQKGYRFIYYRLTLTRCSDGLELQTDPGWGNGGRR